MGLSASVPKPVAVRSALSSHRQVCLPAGSFIGLDLRAMFPRTCPPIAKATVFLALALGSVEWTQAANPPPLMLVLSDHIAPNEPADWCHHVTYPANTEPASKENIFWVVQDPKGESRYLPMQKTGVRVSTPAAGTYRVHAEYRDENASKVVSNVVEVRFPGGAVGTAPAVTGNGDTAADKSKPLAEFLAGTKWLWYARAIDVLEFRPDGKVELADWTRRGLVTGWEATGPNQVTLKIISGRTNNLTATLIFSDDRTSFTGTDFTRGRQIAKSPRTGVEKSPAPEVPVDE
jgi:hypothetical protein